MASITIYRCDRCGHNVTKDDKTVNAVNVSLITAALPVVHRVKMELCFECAEVLARVNREFLSMVTS